MSPPQGFDIKIQSFSEYLFKETKTDIRCSWKQWQSDLEARLSQRSERWTASHKDEEEVIKDYIKQFNKDISRDADKWLKGNILKSVVEPNLDRLDNEILGKLTTIKNSLKSVDNNINTSLRKQFEMLTVESIEFQSKFVSGKGATAFFKSVAVIANMLVIGLVTRAIIDFVSRENSETRKRELKKKVIKRGMAQFLENSDEIVEKIIKDIKNAFDERTEKFHGEADSAIELLRNSSEYWTRRLMPPFLV